MNLLNKIIKVLRAFLRGMAEKNKALILREGQFLNGFYVLLFKQINTGEKWTKDELKQLRGHFWHLAGYVPVLALFLLPGGSLLLPLLAEFLDRRKGQRQMGSGLET